MCLLKKCVFVSRLFLYRRLPPLKAPPTPPPLISPPAIGSHTCKQKIQPDITPNPSLACIGNKFDFYDILKRKKCKYKEHLIGTFLFE